MLNSTFFFVGSYLPYAFMEEVACYPGICDVKSDSLTKEESCSVLVGYYRDSEQLRLTRETGIYYVRTGFRPGAMQFLAGQETPDYLVMHKGDKMEMFRLKRTKPVVMNRIQLEKLGFAPHGDAYLAFEIGEPVDINIMSFDSEFVKKIKSSSIPHIYYFRRNG